LKVAVAYPTLVEPRVVWSELFEALELALDRLDQKFFGKGSILIQKWHKILGSLLSYVHGWIYNLFQHERQLLR